MSLKVLVVTNMYPSAQRPGYGSFVKTQVDSLRALGADVDVLEIPGYLGVLQYFLAMFRVLRMSLAKRYDVVHAHYGTSGFAARAQWRAPVVVSYCGDDLLGHCDAEGNPTRSSLFLAWWHSKLALLVDAVIVKSDEMAQRLPRRDVHVVPNGVDFERFRPLDRVQCRERLGLDRDATYILFPYAPHLPRKNFPLVQAAVDRLNVSTAGRYRVLTVHGRPNEMMPVFMNAADVLVLVSRWEGSPNAVKEAMACNLPVVACDVGDVRKLIASARACAICEPEAADVAAAIRRVLTQKELADGRESSRHLRIECVARRIMDIYLSVVRRKGERGARGESQPLLPGPNRDEV